MANKGEGDGLGEKLADALFGVFAKDKETPNKISDQAILMVHLEQLSKQSYGIYNEETGEASGQTIPIFEVPRNPPRDYVTEIAKSPLDNIGLRRFNNLCVLDSEQPYALPNYLLSQDKQDSSSTLKLTTLQLSLLLPRIRIFKTIFDLKLTEELHIELPFDDVANKDDIERIFSDGRNGWFSNGNLSDASTRIF